jgi:hypothetical protein
MSDACNIKNGLEQGDALSPLLFNFALEHDVGKVQANQKGLELNGLHPSVVHVDVNLLGKSLNIVKRYTGYVLDASNDVGLEVNTEKPKHMFMSCYHRVSMTNPLQM